MTTNATDDERAGQRRWTRIKVVGLVLITCSVALLTGLVGGYVVLVRSGAATLRDAVAEADRLDPGWRLEQIEAKRRADVIPADEDAAARVLAVLDLIPEDWQSTDPKVRAAQGPHRGIDLDEEVGKVEPNARIPADMAAGLAAEMESLSDARDEARPLADLSRGRFVLDYEFNVLETRLPNTQNSRKVARLLMLSAYHRAGQGDIDGALDDCRAIVGVSHAIGDEPMIISQLVRIAEDSVAIKAIERVLAQGEATDAALGRVMARLTKEAEEPFSLIGLRGERASFNDLFGKLADGSLPISALSDGPKLPTGPVRYGPHGWAFFQYNQGIAIHFTTRAVEIAKLPMGQQRARWVEWKAVTKKPESLWRALPAALFYLMLNASDAFPRAHERLYGMLNVTRAIVAMERFRLAFGRWPESIDEIPKSILPDTPIDPYSGRPVRAARVPDGWVVYCVGPDLTDDGGKLDPRFKPDRKGTDWGYRLWDVPNRRRPPADEDPGHEPPDHPQPATEPNR